MDTLTFKDFFPLIGTLATLTAGYYFLSFQANKNRRMKWIEDFRKEVAEFSSIATSVNTEFTIDKGYQLLKSTTVLTLYVFDSPEPPREQFVVKIRALQSMLMEGENAHTTEEDLIKTESFGKKLAEIMSLATTIIINEKRKI